MNSNPLVSVAVVTYNSAKFIEETLDSVLSQTYKNIELIISDDCSTDNTVALCKKWLSKNEKSFVRTKLITVDKNTGVSGNYNRAYDECKGVWVKDLDGDDLLLPDCIQDNLNYVENHPDAVLVFSKHIVFGLSSEKKNLEFDRWRYKYEFFDKQPKEQYDMLKYGSCVPSTPAFFNRAKFIELGLKCDERIPLLEDRIKWLNAILKGVHFDFFDKETVKYRVQEKSISNSNILTPKFYESTRFAFYYYVFKFEYEENQEAAVQNAVSQEMYLYNEYYRALSELNSLKKNLLFRAIFALIHPKKIISKFKR